MKILAFTGAGISKQSNIPTFIEVMPIHIMKNIMRLLNSLKPI